MGQARELAERWWTLFLANDLEGAQKFAAPDLRFRGPGADFNGADALVPYLRTFHEQFGDFERKVKSITGSGDAAFLELELAATHRATGKRVRWYTTDYVQTANGKIVSWHAFWDRVGFGGQLA